MIEQQMRNGKGTASLVLGIISMVLCGGGLIIPLLALVFGRQGMTLADQGLANNRGSAKAGFILGIIGLAWGALWLLLIGLSSLSTGT